MSQIFILVYVGILAITQDTFAWHDNRHRNDRNYDDEIDIFVRERFDDNETPWSRSSSSEEWGPRRPLPPSRPIQQFPFPPMPQNRPFPVPQNRPFPVPQNRPFPVPQNRPLPVPQNRPLPPVPQNRLTTTTLNPRTNPASSTATANTTTATSTTTSAPPSMSTLVTTTLVSPTTQLVQRDESTNVTTHQSTPATASPSRLSSQISTTSANNSTSTSPFTSRGETVSPTATHIALNGLSAVSNESSEESGTIENSATILIDRPVASSVFPLQLFLDPGQDQNDSPDPINHTNTTQDPDNTTDNSAHDPESLASTTLGYKSGSRPEIWTMKEWILIPVNVFVTWIRGNSENEATVSENDTKFFPF